MPKARIWGDWYPENEKGNIAIFCPGCDTHHVIATKTAQENGAIWEFNGDMEKPTFSPSLLVRTGSHAVPEYVDDPEVPPVTCHSLINGGMIRFLDDCSHLLKGQTVELPEVSIR